MCPATTVLVDSLALQAKGSSRPKVSNLQAKGCSLSGFLLIGLIIYLSHLSLFESAWERVGKIKYPVGRVQGRGQRRGSWDAWFFLEGKVRLAAQSVPAAEVVGMTSWYPDSWCRSEPQPGNSVACFTHPPWSFL